MGGFGSSVFWKMILSLISCLKTYTTRRGLTQEPLGVSKLIIVSDMTPSKDKSNPTKGNLLWVVVDEFSSTVESLFFLLRILVTGL